MKRAALVLSSILFLGGALVALPGCETSPRCWFLKGNCLTYDQYLTMDQSANPAPTADLVLKTFGKPMSVHDRDGIRRRIDYYSYSLTGDLKIAEFTFDENEKLVKKELW